MMIVLLMGGTVTKTDSGNGCGTDWPLCHGELIPTNPSVETMIEYSHRAVTGVVGLLIIALCLWTLVAFKDRLDIKIFAFLAFIFMLIQSIVGAGAVVWQQSDLVMALHFGISLISFASLLILTILIMERPGQEFRESVPAFLRKLLYGLLVYTLVVVYTGAFVRHVGATYACVGWPVCSQPTMTFEAWVQMIHRILAGLLFFYTLFVHYTAIRLKHRTSRTGMLFATFLHLVSGRNWCLDRARRTCDVCAFIACVPDHLLFRSHFVSRLPCVPDTKKGFSTAMIKPSTKKGKRIFQLSASLFL